MKRGRENSGCVIFSFFLCLSVCLSLSLISESHMTKDTIQNILSWVFCFVFPTPVAMNYDDVIQSCYSLLFFPGREQGCQKNQNFEISSVFFHLSSEN